MKSELIGKKYGRLTVEKIHHRIRKTGRTVYYYQALCDCGKRVVIIHSNLHKYIDCGGHKESKLVKTFNYEGREINYKDIAKLAKLKNKSYISRLIKQGFTVEEIIKRKYLKERKQTVRTILSKKYGITRAGVDYRLAHGWKMMKKKDDYTLSKMSTRLE